MVLSPVSIQCIYYYGKTETLGLRRIKQFGSFRRLFPIWSVSEEENESNIMIQKSTVNNSTKFKK